MIKIAGDLMKEEPLKSVFKTHLKPICIFVSGYVTINSSKYLCQHS